MTTPTINPQAQPLQFLRQILAGNSGAQLNVNRHRESGTLVLAKTYIPGAQLADEGEILQMVGPHPNIAKMFSQRKKYPNDSLDTIFMEYCKGGTVQELLEHALRKHKKIPESFIWNLLKEVWIVATDLEEKRIIHDDLAPRNIVFVPDERSGHASDYPIVKIIDFGVALDLNGDFDEDVQTNPSENLLSDYMPELLRDLTVYAQVIGSSDALVDWLEKLDTESILPWNSSNGQKVFTPMPAFMDPLGPMPDWMVEYFQEKVAQAGTEVPR